MTDSKRITIFFASLIGLLSLTLVSAALAQAGVWLQQYGKAEGVACEEGWGESWAMWPNDGTGGFVCTREVDDPSQPVEVAAPSGPQYAWVRLGTVTLITRQNGAGSLPLNGCATNPSGLYTGSPLNMRVDNPDVTVTWDSATRFYILRNPTANTITAVVEVECEVL